MMRDELYIEFIDKMNDKWKNKEAAYQGTIANLEFKIKKMDDDKKELCMEIHRLYKAIDNYKRGSHIVVIPDPIMGIEEVKELYRQHMTRLFDFTQFNPQTIIEEYNKHSWELYPEGTIVIIHNKEYKLGDVFFAIGNRMPVGRRLEYHGSFVGYALWEEIAKYVREMNKVL